MAGDRFFEYPGDESTGDGVVFLAGWTDSDWESLFRYTRAQRFARGESVVRAGQTDRALYLIASGELEVVAGEGRRRQTLARIGEGNVVGELAFLDGQAASQDVVAVTDVDVLRLSLDEFETFAAHHPDLGRALLMGLGQIVSVRLRGTTRALLARR